MGLLLVAQEQTFMFSPFSIDPYIRVILQNIYVQLGPAFDVGTS